MAFARQKSDRQPPPRSRNFSAARMVPESDVKNVSSGSEKRGSDRQRETSSSGQRPGEPQPHRSTTLKLTRSGRDKLSIREGTGVPNQQGQVADGATKECPNPAPARIKSKLRDDMLKRPTSERPSSSKSGVTQARHPQAAEDNVYFGPGISVELSGASTAAVGSGGHYVSEICSRGQQRTDSPGQRSGADAAQSDIEAVQCLHAEVDVLNRKNKKLASQVAKLEKLLQEQEPCFPRAPIRGKPGDTAAALSRRMQLLKAQNVQLERHAAALEEELATCGDLVAEAEACVQGAIQYLGEGMVLKNQTGTNDALQNHWAGFERWARHMLQRLKRCQVQTKASLHDRFEDGKPQDPDFVAAGGNRFLSPSMRQGLVFKQPDPSTIPKSLSIRDVIDGNSVSMLIEEPTQLHALEALLSDVAGKLDSLTISMRASVLPAMRFFENELAAGIQVKISEATSFAAQAANDLAELSVLIPARSTLSSRQISSKRMSKAAIFKEAEDVNFWGSLLDTAPELDVTKDGLSSAQFNLPQVDEVLTAVPSSSKGQEVLKQLMERASNRERLHRMRQHLLESELHALAAIQSIQAENWNSLLDMLHHTVDAFEENAQVANRQARNSLDTVLQVAGDLLQDPSEASLKKMVNLLAIHMPILKQIPGLLDSPKSISQQEDGARDSLQTLNSVLIATWEAVCNEQDRLRNTIIHRMQEELKGIPAQAHWDTEEMHPKNKLKADQQGWETSLRDQSHFGSQDLGHVNQAKFSKSEVMPERGRLQSRISSDKEGSTPNASSSSKKMCKSKKIAIEDRPAFDLDFLTDHSQPDDAANPPEPDQHRRRSKNQLQDRPPFQLGD